MYICVQNCGATDPGDTDSSRDVFLSVDILQRVLAVVMELHGETTGKLSCDEKMKDRTNNQYLFLMNVAVKLAWRRVLLTHCVVSTSS